MKRQIKLIENVETLNLYFCYNFISRKKMKPSTHLPDPSPCTIAVRLLIGVKIQTLHA